MQKQEDTLQRRVAKALLKRRLRANSIKKGGRKCRKQSERSRSR